jgi:hypothetical protein
MASQPEQRATDYAICNEHFESSSALALHKRDSPEHAEKLEKLQHKLAILRRTFECEGCFRCFGTAEALTEQKIEFERQKAERARRAALGLGLDSPTLKALTEFKRNAERLAKEHAQQVASDDELSLQTLSLEPPSDDSPWSTHADLHDSVLRRLEENGLSITFHEEGEAKDSIRDYGTTIMGASTCPNQSCPTKKWTSKNVAISIWLFDNQRYNAAVWHQRCQECESMGILKPDEESYTDRVAYRLGKWLGLASEAPRFRRRIEQPPHVKALCEGCKSGRCRAGDFRGGQVMSA